MSCYPEKFKKITILRNTLIKVPKYLFIKGNLYFCCVCGHCLSNGYSYIMELLEGQNLLPKNYQHYCCHCKFVANELKKFTLSKKRKGNRLSLVCENIKLTVGVRELKYMKASKSKIYLNACKFILDRILPKEGF